MKFATAFKPLRTAAAIAAIGLLGAAGNASAITVSGNFNANGYDTFSFTVGALSTVNIAYTGGYGDPTFSLFNSSGAHLVTNDDSSDLGLYSHLTQNLAAGSYSLLVSYCCSSAQYAVDNGAVFDSTDGFINGSYWFGGSGTLTGMESYLDQFGAAPNQPYALTIDNVTLNVPEPTSLALFGIAALGLSMRSRRRAA